MRYHYTYVEDQTGHWFDIFDAKRGFQTPIAQCDQRDDAELIVKALNAVYDGPFALDAIPNCVIKEIM